MSELHLTGQAHRGGDAVGYIAWRATRLSVTARAVLRDALAAVESLVPFLTGFAT
ncbi:MAG: hypothetical protein ACTS8S_10840 [Giesbergeria sp.]